MTLEKRNKLLYWVFKIGGVLISCAFPIWAICEKFPFWETVHGSSRSIGVGGILILIVLLVIFRKSVFGFLKERMKLKHAPPIVAWLVMLIVAYVLQYINNFIKDMTTIFWMGMLGCAFGTVLTFVAENHFRKKEKNDDGHGN